jgi:hypothetical protein
MDWTVSIHLRAACAEAAFVLLIIDVFALIPAIRTRSDTQAANAAHNPIRGFINTDCLTANHGPNK